MISQLSLVMASMICLCTCCTFASVGKCSGSNGNAAYRLNPFEFGVVVTVECINGGSTVMSDDGG